MRIFDPHIHMTSRTTDDYQRMHAAGVTAVVEPAFWLGQPRTNVGSFLDYFLPTAVETPVWETDFTVTPSPHHPIGAKGVGESPNVGGVSAFSNAVCDAFAHLGLTHTQMPHDHWRVWKTAQKLGLVK